MHISQMLPHHTPWAVCGIDTTLQIGVKRRTADDQVLLSSAWVHVGQDHAAGFEGKDVDGVAVVGEGSQEGK